jgi:chromosome segregation ATPase
MNVEERFEKNEAAIRDLIVVSRSLVNAMQELHSSVREMHGSMAELHGSMAELHGSMTEMRGTMKESIQELRQSISELLNAQKDSDEKLNILIHVHTESGLKVKELAETVDKIIRERGGLSS